MALPPENNPPRNIRPAQGDAAQQGVLMREVDEAVRQDEMANAAKRYGLPIVAAVIVAVLAFGGWLLWKDRTENALGKSSEEFVTALDKVDAGQLTAADQELAVLADGSGGVAVAAQLSRAGIALQNGKMKEAVALYDDVAANDDAPQPYRDLAAVRSVAAQFEDMSPQQVVDRLKPLAVPGNPWFGSAGELVAMAYIKQGKQNLAGPLLVEISKGEDVPESLKSRTRQIAGLLGYDAITDVDATLDGMRADGAAPSAQ